MYIGNRYLEEFGKRLFIDIFGECLLDVVFNLCLKNEKVIKIFIDEIKFYLDKLLMLFEKRKYKIEI